MVSEGKLASIEERLERLEEAIFGSGQPGTGKAPVPQTRTSRVNFGLNERAFVKKYAGGMSGSKKFVLLLAFLAKGEIDRDVDLEEVGRLWNRMTSPLGGKFNDAYPTRAKDDGWVDSKKRGSYCLTSDWEEILRK